MELGIKIYNIIRNLDFASSYQSLAVGIIETSNILFLVEENEFIENVLIMLYNRIYK